MLHPSAPAYSLKGTGRDKFASFTNDHNHEAKSIGPGPKYNLFNQGIKTRSVSFTQGKAKRPPINDGVEKTPGPSGYNPEVNAQSSEVGFPKSSRRDDIPLNNNPGPDFYKPIEEPTYKKITTYTMGAKYPSIMDDVGKNPGPGDYQQPLTKTESFLSLKRSKFGTTKRFSQPNFQTTPGVGMYELRTAEPILKKNSKFGTSQRNQKMKEVTPGPGEYGGEQKSEEGKDKKKVKGKTMAVKLPGSFNFNSETIDSFNNYFREVSNKNSAPFYSIGKQKREAFKPKSYTGPADYLVQQVEKNTPSAMLPKSKYQPYNQLLDIPGPGTYKDHEETPKKKYTIPRSKSMGLVNQNPGVGRYQISNPKKDDGKGIKIGKGKRSNFICKNFVGVGEYEILSKKLGGVSIPKASRFQQKEVTPGPGDYNAQSTLSNFNFYKKTV